MRRDDPPLRQSQAGQQPIEQRYRGEWEREVRVESPRSLPGTRPIWGHGFYGEGDPRNIDLGARSERTEEQSRAGGAMDPGGHGAVGGRLVANRGPRGYVRSDENVYEDVCSALTADEVVDATHIDVRVSNGEVTLSGFVDSRHAKIWAERLASRVDGVRDVRSFLRVATLEEWDWEPLRVGGEPVPNRVK